MYVYDPNGVDPQRAHELALQIVAALRRHSEDHRVPLDLDADLRPEGRNGPLARSLDAYAEYYRRWSLSWEAQALLRARGVAGSVKLISAFTALADDVRYPAVGRPAGPPRDQAHQGPRRERAPAAGRRPGPASQARPGLAQRRRVARAAAAAASTRTRVPGHAHDVDDRGAARRRGGRAACPRAPRTASSEAWRLASRLRSANTLLSGQTSDVLPDRPQAARRHRPSSRVPAALGDAGRGGLPRRDAPARRVFEKLFYG